WGASQMVHARGWFRRQNWGVSLQQAATQAQAAVERMRSLFGPLPQAPLVEGASLDAPAQSATGAGRRAAVLSGDLVDRHQEFVGHAAGSLTSDAHADTTLCQQLTTAATV